MIWSPLDHKCWVRFVTGFFTTAKNIGKILYKIMLAIEVGLSSTLFIKLGKNKKKCQKDRNHNDTGVKCKKGVLILINTV